MTDRMVFFKHGQSLYEGPFIDIFYHGESNPETNRVPSKAMGRIGTRRAWKRKNPPQPSYRNTLIRFVRDARLEG